MDGSFLRQALRRLRVDSGYAAIYHNSGAGLFQQHQLFGPGQPGGKGAGLPREPYLCGGRRLCGAAHWPAYHRAYQRGGRKERAGIGGSGPYGGLLYCRERDEGGQVRRLLYGRDHRKDHRKGPGLWRDKGVPGGILAFWRQGKRRCRRGQGGKRK